MYIQRVPHPLRHFNRDLDTSSVLNAFQASSTNGTTFSAVSQSKPHAPGYVVLVVVLVLLLLSLAGIFIARRRVRALLPCFTKRNKKPEKLEHAPRMQREGRTRFTDGFDIVPSFGARAGSRSGSSRTPSSPYSEGPSTPCEELEHERGDLGINSTLDYAKEECSFVPIPIIVHTPTQTHQTTFLTGPNVTSSDFIAPTAHHEHFFDERLPMTGHGSYIRPHGLPLSPVPEESSAVVSFSSPYFEVDEETLYGTIPDTAH